MKWEEYEKNYRGIAKLKNKDDAYCIEQLQYAKILYDKNVPIIYNQEHFSKLVGYSYDYLIGASNGAKSYYRTFYINKSNGKKRRIDEPLPNLKEIQYWILHEILEKISISPYAKAYIKDKSIRENARFHKKQKKILCMDIEDFFGSISYNRVLSVFRKLGYRENVSVLLANLCCLNKALPQGAPTSPILSNIIASSLDYKISEYVKKENIRYTRYADDLTFSGDFSEGHLISSVERICNKYGFVINNKKTRVRKKNQRQEVTGIVVNEKMQINAEKRKHIRAEAYYIKKYGYQSHIEYHGIKRERYLYHLIGMSSYALFINPYDENMKSYLAVFKKALNDEKLIQSGNNMATSTQ